MHKQNLISNSLYQNVEIAFDNAWVTLWWWWWSLPHSLNLPILCPNLSSISDIALNGFRYDGSVWCKQVTYEKVCALNFITALMGLSFNRMKQLTYKRCYFPVVFFSPFFLSHTFSVLHWAIQLRILTAMVSGCGIVKLEQKKTIQNQKRWKLFLMLSLSNSSCLFLLFLLFLRASVSYEAEIKCEQKYFQS